MSQPLPDPFAPQWFIPFFVVMWLVISAVLALLSGWSGLATRFRTDGTAQGEQFRFVSGSMGAGVFPVNYGTCLFLKLNEQGFQLSVFFLFRFFSPPLFIPWSQVESVTERRFLFRQCAAVRIRGHEPVLSFYGKAGKRILEVYGKLSGNRAR